MEQNQKAAQECATAWFLLLETALANGDQERERIARENLERLGFAIAILSTLSTPSHGRTP